MDVLNTFLDKENPSTVIVALNNISYYFFNAKLLVSTISVANLQEWASNVSLNSSKHIEVCIIVSSTNKQQSHPSVRVIFLFGNSDN